MLDLDNEWTISFAGCGFMGIYYVGASSCILERYPRLIQNASKIYGASAGALMASVLALGIPLEKCCADLMFMAKEARKRRLGPLHPAYNLLEIVRDSMERNISDDAHVRASGRLCVSLTRMPNGKNVLVSEFDSKEELIQALLCSCFVPLYCGVIPPTYRGVHYVDGAVSDNLPCCHLKNTITISAYAGESDLCPQATRANFHEVRFNNVSIEVSAENLYRVTSTFFPPEPEAMAEICRNGYLDALRFLQENGLISTECHLKGLSPRPACCELVKERNENTEQSGEKRFQDEHQWLDPQLIQRLPVNVQEALCEACRDTHTSVGLLSQVSSYLRLPYAQSVGSAYSLAQRMVDWIPEVPRDMSWIYGMAGEMYRKAWKDDSDDEYEGEVPLRRCTSLPMGLNLCRDQHPLPPPPGGSPTSSFTAAWTPDGGMDHMPLTPPPTPTLTPAEFGGAAAESPKGWGLGRAVGGVRNKAPEHGSKVKRSDDSMSFSEVK